MKADTSSFISNKYRPSGVILQDPRNMHLDDIRNVLQHCFSLQTEAGPELSFRFSVFIFKKKRLFAEYPSDVVEPAESEANRHKKDKGKQREDALQLGKAQTADSNRRHKKGKEKQREDALEGLLRIDESEEPPTLNDIEIAIPTVAGPSNNRSANIPDKQTSVQSPGNRLVRIDMGRMLQLRNMGYEVLGPLNGPNEGYPEYEVPQTVLDKVTSLAPSQHAWNPRPIQYTEQLNEIVPSPTPIDPVLPSNGQETNQNQQIFDNTATIQTDEVDVPVQTDGQNLPLPTGAEVHPTPITIMHAESDVNSDIIQNKTPKKKLGKRTQANLSPQTVKQTRNTNKKKKITDDDLAALEAQKMMQSGSKRKSKPTRRK